MKKGMSLLLILIIFIMMLCFPRETFMGASNGLLLWFQTLLPTLLPFMIVSNLLIHTNAILYITKITKPILQKIFRVSDNACYAVFVGFMCGYPMGAKVIADLIKTNRISQKEGQYLLSFCNNTSPIFIISYIVMQNFRDKSLLLGTLLILYAVPVICSLLFRTFYRDSKNVTLNPVTVDKFTFQFQMLDESIMNGFESITKVGGYIILFSVLFTLFNKFPIPWLLPVLEISNGIPYLLSLDAPLALTYPCVLALTSFGGLCAVAQTYSMIQETKLSICTYIIQKLITALVTSFFAILYILFIHQ